MADVNDKLPCTDILQEISGTACYLNEDFWGREKLYPAKKKMHHHSVSGYIESILSFLCFHILTFVPVHLNGE